MADPAPSSAGPGAAVRSGLIGAAVFVLGLLAGGIAVGLLDGGAPPSAAADEDPDARTEGPGSVVDLGRPGEFVVNAACLDALNAAQDAYVVAQQLGEATAALDAARLDEVVRRLQPLQSDLERDLVDCEVTGTVAGSGAVREPDVAPEVGGTAPDAESSVPGGAATGSPLPVPQPDPDLPGSGPAGPAPAGAPAGPSPAG